MLDNQEERIILIFGESDLSFTCVLRERFPEYHIISTIYKTIEKHTNYHSFQSNLDLLRGNVEFFDDVDVTGNLERVKHALGDRKVAAMFFTFPYPAEQLATSSYDERTKVANEYIKTLIIQMMVHGKEILCEGGLILVSIETYREKIYSCEPLEGYILYEAPWNNYQEYKDQGYSHLQSHVDIEYDNKGKGKWEWRIYGNTLDITSIKSNPFVKDFIKVNSNKGVSTEYKEGQESNPPFKPPTDGSVIVDKKIYLVERTSESHFEELIRNYGLKEEKYTIVKTNKEPEE